MAVISKQCRLLALSSDPGLLRHGITWRTLPNHSAMAAVARQVCIAAALQAYEDAGLSGLCHEGRWEYAMDAMRGVPLRPLIQALLHEAEGEAGGYLPR